MKYFVSNLIVTLLITCSLQAQPLNSQFNAIAANHNMMGGSLVVFCKNGIMHNIAVGKSDSARNINASVNTKYRIASISKTITAIAIMQLAEKGSLNIDTDISTILGYTVKNPTHPNTAITTRMLLSHTSTIIDGPTYNNFLSATVNNNPIPNLSEILTTTGAYYSASTFNTTVPGTYFNYSNLNYVILGTIVEKVSNLRFDVYCKQNISTPLGIDASFNVNDLANINDVAVLYRKTSGVWTPQIDNYQGVPPVFNNLSGYVPGTNGGRFGPQGGFRCSAQDLAKIFLVIMNKGTFDGVTLLSAASCNAMLANEWTYNGSNGNNYYGLFRSWGLGIHRLTGTAGGDIGLPGSSFMFGHAGEAYGLVSDAYFDTARKVGFVFITNGVGNGYQTNSQSAFYTVEQDVYKAIEDHGTISSCNAPAGLEETGNEQFAIYPNPTNGAVRLHIPQQNILNVKVYDINGRSVLESTNTNLDLSQFSSGTYIMKAQTEKGLYWRKVIRD